ncbi:hypothetical protein HDU92_004530 [Lobulomyces angularis]|nr:hypothetical protein HDU92_004530 [Lobulomyces angularis]
MSILLDLPRFVIVANISHSGNSRNLSQFINTLCAIKILSIKFNDSTSKCKTAIIEFQNSTDATGIVEVLDGFAFHGKNLQVGFYPQPTQEVLMALESTKLSKRFESQQKGFSKKFEDFSTFSGQNFPPLLNSFGKQENLIPRKFSDNQDLEDEALLLESINSFKEDALINDKKISHSLPIGNFFDNEFFNKKSTSHNSLRSSSLLTSGLLNDNDGRIGFFVQKPISPPLSDDFDVLKVSNLVPQTSASMGNYFRKEDPKAVGAQLSFKDAGRSKFKEESVKIFGGLH